MSILDISKLSSRLYTKKEMRTKIIAEYTQKLAEIDKEIAEEKEALTRIKEILSLYTCKACGGSGEERFIDAAGSRDSRKCGTCRGTGIEPEAGEEGCL